MHFPLLRRILISIILLCSFSSCFADVTPGEGADLQAGGPGSGPGQFLELRDIAFDASGNLYALDGCNYDSQTGKRTGNLRIERFSPDGKFVSEYSVNDPDLGNKNDPRRIVVDQNGNAYITEPSADFVLEYDPKGALLHTWRIPAAEFITIVHTPEGERTAVIGQKSDILHILNPVTASSSAIHLSKKLENIQAIACDQKGFIYIIAAVNQLYKFGLDGKLVSVLGAGTATRAQDGSEVIHTVAVDSKGFIYTMVWGNPGMVTRFDPGMTTVTRREGQFHWADAWSINSGYTALAVDNRDRLWAACTGLRDPHDPNYSSYHPRPVVLRIAKNFFDPDQNGVLTSSALLLGFNPVVSTSAPYNIAYNLKPISLDIIAPPAIRRIKEATIMWQAFDMYRHPSGMGKFILPLKDGVAAKHTFYFTPSRFGWYEVQCDVLYQNKDLRTLGIHLGVTPAYSNMPVLHQGESPGGWVDAPRQMFAGLPCMRLSAGNDPGAIEKDVGSAIKNGASFFVQFPNKNDCTPENVRHFVEYFKGRVQVWEIMNEPNFFMKPDEYVALLKELYPIIKSVDPSAKVMGPAVCGIQLPWYESFYQLGGGKFCDILSEHDYEGNESIDPVHWIWKYDALRKLMAQYGDESKPIWQTERAIGGIRGDNFLGGAQAVRITLHRDLLETEGIPAEHNNHFYLNEGGYGPVPTYVWSAAGPHPAALATRTRQAMIAGRTYTGKLDFGPTGNRFFLGLRYQNSSGQTITLRNYGLIGRPVSFRIQGVQQLNVIDSFGNRTLLPVKSGKAVIMIFQMPCYLQLPAAASIKPLPLDFGKNIASSAIFQYSSKSNGNFGSLNNGILETIHDGDPHGNTGNPSIFIGELPSLPQYLELKLDKPHKISHLILFGLRSDNAFCSLLDYDLQYSTPKGWMTISRLHTPCPPADPVITPQCTYTMWGLDDNIYVNDFHPIIASKLRIVVHRTTFGFMTDSYLRAWGNKIPAKLMLREIEIY
jgi:hypothetical protein